MFSVRVAVLVLAFTGLVAVDQAKSQPQGPSSSGRVSPAESTAAPAHAAASAAQTKAVTVKEKKQENASTSGRDIAVDYDRVVNPKGTNR